MESLRADVVDGVDVVVVGSLPLLLPPRVGSAIGGCAALFLADSPAKLVTNVSASLSVSVEAAAAVAVADFAAVADDAVSVTVAEFEASITRLSSSMSRLSGGSLVAVGSAMPKCVGGVSFIGVRR